MGVNIAIVAIDTRIVPALVHTAHRAAKAVGAEHIFVWCGKDNFAWGRDAFTTGDTPVTVTVSQLGEHELPTTPEKYSHLLLRRDPIWSTLQRMQVQHALFVQSDVTIVRNPSKHEISMWCKYAYIGAPWTHFNPCRKMVPNGVGNGGVSLRAVDECVATLENINESQFKTWPEDVYFAHALDPDRVAPINIAAGFACEVPLEDLHLPEAAPFALHKAESFCPLPLRKAWGVVVSEEKKDTTTTTTRNAAGDCGEREWWA